MPYIKREDIKSPNCCGTVYELTPAINGVQFVILVFNTRDDHPDFFKCDANGRVTDWTGLIDERWTPGDQQLDDIRAVLIRILID